MLVIKSKTKAPILMMKTGVMRRGAAQVQVQVLLGNNNICGRDGVATSVTGLRLPPFRPRLPFPSPPPLPLRRRTSRRDMMIPPILPLAPIPGSSSSNSNSSEGSSSNGNTGGSSAVLLPNNRVIRKEVISREISHSSHFSLPLSSFGRRRLLLLRSCVRCCCPLRRMRWRLLGSLMAAYILCVVGFNFLLCVDATFTRCCGNDDDDEDDGGGSHMDKEMRDSSSNTISRHPSGLLASIRPICHKWVRQLTDGVPEHRIRMVNSYSVSVVSSCRSSGCRPSSSNNDSSRSSSSRTPPPPPSFKEPLLNDFDEAAVESASASMTSPSDGSFFFRRLCTLQCSPLVLPLSTPWWFDIRFFPPFLWNRTERTCVEVDEGGKRKIHLHHHGGCRSDDDRTRSTDVAVTVTDIDCVAAARDFTHSVWRHQIWKHVTNIIHIHENEHDVVNRQHRQRDQNKDKEDGKKGTNKTFTPLNLIVSGDEVEAARQQNGLIIATEDQKQNHDDDVHRRHHRYCYQLQDPSTPTYLPYSITFFGISVCPALWVSEVYRLEVEVNVPEPIEEEKVAASLDETSSRFVETQPMLTTSLSPPPGESYIRAMYNHDSLQQQAPPERLMETPVLEKTGADTTSVEDEAAAVAAAFTREFDILAPIRQLGSFGSFWVSIWQHRILQLRQRQQQERQQQEPLQHQHQHQQSHSVCYYRHKSTTTSTPSSSSSELTSSAGFSNPAAGSRGRERAVATQHSCSCTSSPSSVVSTAEQQYQQQARGKGEQAFIVCRMSYRQWFGPFRFFDHTHQMSMPIPSPMIDAAASATATATAVAAPVGQAGVTRENEIVDGGDDSRRRVDVQDVIEFSVLGEPLLDAVCGVLIRRILWHRADWFVTHFAGGGGGDGHASLPGPAAMWG